MPKFYSLVAMLKDGLVEILVVEKRVILLLNFMQTK